MTSSDPCQYVKKRLEEIDSANPLYYQVMLALQDAVETEVLPPGSFLPSERDLSKALKVSRVTLRRAIDELVKSGMAVRKQGSQTKIVSRYEKTISNLTGFSEDTRARGQEPGATWLSKKTVAPTSSEAIALNLSLNERVIRIQRLRTADGKPLAIELATLPQSILPTAELIEDSLYDALDKLGMHPEYGVQRLRASIMTKEDAELLESEVGAPLLIMERCCFLADGRAVEFTQTRYAGDSYEFVTQLKR